MGRGGSNREIFLSECWVLECCDPQSNLFDSQTFSHGVIVTLT